MRLVWSICALVAIASSSSDMTLEEKRVENALFVMAGEEPPHDVPLNHKEITLHDMLLTGVKAVKDSHIGHVPHGEQDHSGHEHHEHHKHEGHEGHEGHQGHEGHEAHGAHQEHKDHKAHGHGDHGGHMMMMWFHWGCNEVILFDFWRINTNTGLIVSCVIIFVMGALYEGLKWFRLYLSLIKKDKNLESTPSAIIEMKVVTRSDHANNNAADLLLANAPPKSSETVQPGPFSLVRLSQALLYIVQLVIAYWLMLIVMTYNIWLTFAVVLGAGFGHWLFAALRLANPSGEAADSIATDACH